MTVRVRVVPKPGDDDGFALAGEGVLEFFSIQEPEHAPEELARIVRMALERFDLDQKEGFPDSRTMKKIAARAGQFVLTVEEQA